MGFWSLFKNIHFNAICVRKKILVDNGVCSVFAERMCSICFFFSQFTHVMIGRNSSHNLSYLSMSRTIACHYHMWRTMQSTLRTLSKQISIDCRSLVRKRALSFKGPIIMKSGSHIRLTRWILIFCLYSFLRLKQIWVRCGFCTLFAQLQHTIRHSIERFGCWACDIT